MPRKMFESDDDYEKRLLKEAKKNDEARRELAKRRKSPHNLGGPGRARGVMPKLFRRSDKR